MSFRSRLTRFFVLIVVVPMIAVAVLVFRLIGDSEQGKADARASGLAAAAASLYASQSASARADAQVIARQLAGVPAASLRPRLAMLAAQGGLTRLRVSAGSRVLADVGASDAIAPGRATLRLGASAPLTVTVSVVSARDYVRDLSSAAAAVVVRSGSRTIGSSLAVRAPRPFPPRGTISLAGRRFRAATETAPGFGSRPVQVTVLSDLTSTQSSLAASRLVAVLFIVGFLLLAFAFSVLASRALQGQIRRFLEAARRLGRGDFSAPVPIEGQDEFAALGEEFNSMSSQLARRLEELSQERERLRESIGRIGHAFASNLDRGELLKLALRTSIEAVQADGGRISMRIDGDQPLGEALREGDLRDLDAEVLDAERRALTDGRSGEAAGEDGVLALTLGTLSPAAKVRGLLTVVRRAGRFRAEDQELLRSLASQATVALENVDLHAQVSRQAVTDELTGLANHGRFQDILAGEVEQVRRYRHPLSLIMLDVDDFKGVNDTYGHQQGDAVLRQVARVLSENSRETDTPARYGGEEMALILPHTDLEGCYAIAERVRTAVEKLRISLLDGDGVLKITASLGVAGLAADGEKDGLIANADAALYTAKRSGKNRTVRAPIRAASVTPASKV